MTRTFSQIVVHTDGGARGNPGPAAIGIVIQEGERVIHESGMYIGEATNNIAEYTAIREALVWLSHNRVIGTVACYLDSLLVVQQLKGLYKIKNKNLQKLAGEIKQYEMELESLLSIPIFLARKTSTPMPW